MFKAILLASTVFLSVVSSANASNKCQNPHVLDCFSMGGGVALSLNEGTCQDKLGNWYSLEGMGGTIGLFSYGHLVKMVCTSLPKAGEFVELTSVGVTAGVVCGVQGNVYFNSRTACVAVGAGFTAGAAINMAAFTLGNHGKDQKSAQRHSSAF